MKYFRVLGLFISVLTPFGIPGPAHAADGFTLECEVTSQGPDGGFGSHLYIAFTNDWANPAALNWAIQEIYKTPIPVTLVSNSGQRARIRWELKGLKYDGGRSIGRTIYRASVDKASLDLQLTLDIPASDGRYFAQGKCKKIQ